MLLWRVGRGGYDAEMTQNGWAKAVTLDVAREVRRYRKMRGMSTERLAARCAELGSPIHRSVLANLESGRRENITVPDLVTLGRALGVPPILLLYPVGYADTVEVLPGREVHPWDGIRWFTGEIPDLDGGQDDRSSPISLFSLHHTFVSQWSREQEAAAAAMKAARETGIPEAMQQARLEMESASYLPVIRATMRTLGYLPPDLPPEIAAALGEEA
jgi:transcriptional regulator with XRE-family HTH domain